MLHRAAEVHGGGELQGVEVPAALLQPVRQHVDVEVVGREGDDGHLVAELGAAFKPKKIKKASTPPPLGQNMAAFQECFSLCVNEENAG